MAFFRRPSLRPAASEGLVPSVALVVSLTAPVLLPLGVLLVQALFWDLIAPYAWLGFLPAVAGSAWLSGLRGGLLAATLSFGASEWLLAFGDPHLPQGPEPRIFSAFAFSLLSLAVVLFLDRARRESMRLHRAVRRLGGVLLGDVPPATTASWIPGGHATLEDLALIEAVHGEMLWRKTALTQLPLPLAAFALDGKCLYANPAFAAALALDPASMGRRNLLAGGDFPGAALTQAMYGLIATPGPGRSERAMLGLAGEALLQWLATDDGGVVLCTVWPGTAVANIPARPSGLSSGTSPPTQPDPITARRDERAPGSAAPLSLAGLRCLVVDDQAVNRELMREILGFEGVVVSTCASGREAIERVRGQPQDFDVVLMDLQMPGMDGYATARALRGLPGAADLPVFAITADGPGIPQERLRQAGMRGVLHKPLEIEGLIALLERIRQG